MTLNAPVNLPLTEPRFTGDVGRTFRESDPPQFPQPARPSKGAPSVVIILLDDVGFGQFSAFGDGIPSPTMHKLAAKYADSFDKAMHAEVVAAPTVKAPAASQKK